MNWNCRKFYNKHYSNNRVLKFGEKRKFIDTNNNILDENQINLDNRLNNKIKNINLKNFSVNSNLKEKLYITCGVNETNKENQILMKFKENTTSTGKKLNSN